MKKTLFWLGLLVEEADIFLLTFSLTMNQVKFFFSYLIIKKIDSSHHILKLTEFDFHFNKFLKILLSKSDIVP